MPGNYLLDAGDPCETRARSAVRTLTLTNKGRGRARSLIPLCLILHGFQRALSDGASHKDRVETSSLLVAKIAKRPSRCRGSETATLTANLAAGKVSDPPPLTITTAQRKESFTHSFQIKRNIPLHLFAGLGFAQLG